MPLKLRNEAVTITEELGDVVFIGALAVDHYSPYRTTTDVDLAIANPLDDKKLIGLGYTKLNTRGSSWLSPRGVKVDFYTEDVGRIPVSWILENPVIADLGKKAYRVICLEGLVLTKHRAARSQDTDDLRRLLSQHGNSINWDLMEQIATDVELKELKQLSKILSS